MKHTDGNMRIARWGPANLKSDVAIAGPPGSRKPNRGGVKAVSVTIAEFSVESGALYRAARSRPAFLPNETA